MKLFTRHSGSGPPLIILHGLFGMSDNWLSLAKYFSERFEVFVPDLRNHGQSPHSKDWNLHLMSEDILELIASHHVRKPFIIGHSLGGKVAMTLALNHPHQISKLIVADIAPRAYHVSEFHLHVIRALKNLELSSRKDVETKLIAEGFNSATIGLLMKNLFWKEDKLAWRFNLHALEAHIAKASEEIFHEQKTFSEPALFLSGEKSDYIREEDHPLILKLFPFTQFQKIQNAGHWLHADQPQEFFDACTSFLIQ